MKDPKIEYKDVKEAYLDSLKNTIRKETEKLQSELSDSSTLFNSYLERIERIESKNSTAKLINETDWLKSKLYDLIESCYPPIEILSIEEFFNEFFKKTENYSNGIPLEIKCHQEEDRFRAISDERLYIKILKNIKRVGFGFSRLPQYFLNLFRKEKKAIKPWSHSIPLRRIYIFYFKELFISKGLEYYEKIYLNRTIIYQALWDIDDLLNDNFTDFLNKDELDQDHLISSIKKVLSEAKIDSLHKKLNLFKEEFESDLTLIFNDLIVKAEDSIAKVDTLELGRSKFSAYRLGNIQKKNKSDFLRIENGWRNTLFSQLDDFELDLELFHFKYLNLKQQRLVNDSCSNRISSTLSDALVLFDNEFEKLENEIKEVKSKKNLFDLLAERKKEISKKLDLIIIPKAKDAILNQNLPGLVERMENSMQKQIEKIKDKRLIYPENKYHSPTKSSEINQLNPQEIVEVTIYKPNAKRFQEIKAYLVQKIEIIQTEVNDLSQIVDYNLESAIDAKKEEATLKEVINISIEGLERVKSKHEEIKLSLKEIEDWLQTSLNDVVLNINEKLIELTDEDSIIKVKLELAKTKALERSNAYKKEVIQKLKEFVPKTIDKSKVLLKSLNEKIDTLLKQSGLRQEDLDLSSELSDFLTETEKALDKLPYVYRRLYQIYPLEDDSFFVGREEEIKKLEGSFEDWKKGLFSASLIHGEKGSGISSLINNFISNINGIEVFRYKVTENITTENALLSFLKEIIKGNKAETFDDIINSVNQGKKKVFIIEQSHNLFLKKVDGFIALEKILEFITATADNVFWLIEMNSFSYKYLSKTIEIEQYFKHIVSLNKLEDSQIIDLILKRHRVSGYNIQFLPIGLSIQERKKLRKLSSEDQQDYLKKQFFTRLNEFSQSNISLALLFWLRSTRKVEKNTIFLERLPNLKFDFLKNLKDDVVFTLYILVLHSSITAEDYASLMLINSDKARRQLLVLEERGVLRIEEGRYRINHLLYRQIVSMLRNRNIIH